MMWIKRESGVNPGQSRCCEAPFNILKTTNATDDSVDSGELTVDSFSVSILSVNCYLSTVNYCVGKASGWESVRRPAVH
ncbi:hypothetical protein GGQ57_000166 [Parabacteroides faecis]|uniref:Uncharacterized protein n=1 Tax=Parabacteroides faecis TaxID=1217282 RepID=A0ABR6KHC7_9BACT|nr:hypothetical protein [Parabacteroides faecis]